jgi:cell division septal protein FtsQ
VIKGNNKIPTSEINAIISAGIEKKIVFLETKSIFLADSKSIRGGILKTFLQIKKADINKKFPDRIIVNIEERTAVANFCMLESCFYIDRDGVAFESGENNMNITIRNNDAGYNVSLGQEALKKEYITGILKIQDEMERNFNLNINSFLVLNDKLEVLTPEDWKIYFDPEKDFSGQIVNLISVLKEQIPTEKRAKLDYIDLRFGEDKIFYKYKD